MPIGQRIKELRKNMALSAEELAQYVGVSPATMYRYENSDTKKIPVEVLFQIARKLHTSVDYLVGATDEPDATGVLLPLEHALMAEYYKGKLFRDLLMLSGLKETVDDDGNVTIYRLGSPSGVSETPEMISRVMDQVASYFVFLVLNT